MKKVIPFFVSLWAMVLLSGCASINAHLEKGGFISYVERSGVMVNNQYPDRAMVIELSVVKPKPHNPLLYPYPSDLYWKEPLYMTVDIYRHVTGLGESHFFASPRILHNQEFVHVRVIFVDSNKVPQGEDDTDIYVGYYEWRAGWTPEPRPLR